MRQILLGVFLAGAFLCLSPITAQAATNPLLATYDTPGDALDVAISGDYAYVADGTSLLVLNISTPTAPTLAGRYITDNANRLDLVGNRLYIAGGTFLRIFDVSTPTAPALLGSFEGLGMTIGNVSVSGNYVYFTGISGNTTPILGFINAADPNHPTLENTICPGSSLADIAATSTYVYVITNNKLSIYNTGWSLSLAGEYNDSFTDAVYQHLAVSGSMVYIDDIMHGFHKLDVTNPAAITSLYQNEARYGAGVAVANGHAYLGNYFGGGITVYSLSGSGSPTISGALIGSGNGLNLAVSSSLGLMANGPTGVLIFDITNPDTTAPTITLVGDNFLYVPLGQTFTEPGASATDIAEGDVTNHIVVSGSVDTKHAGSYALTYTANDTSQNISTATRTVIVYPTISQPTVNHGSINIKVGKKTVRLRPFTDYSGPVVVRKVYVHTNTDPSYIFIPTGAMPKPELVIYNNKGKVTKRQGLKSISTKGLNYQIAVDPATASINIALAPKTASLTATWFGYSYTGLKTLGKVTAATGQGTLVFKLLRINPNQLGLVTMVRNKINTPKVWLYKPISKVVYHHRTYDITKLTWSKTTIRLK